MQVLDSAGGCIPSSDQVLFLKACTQEPEAALPAWREWKSCQSLDSVDGAVYKLLPLLFRNLSRAGYNEPDMSIIKGVYRHTWCQNQILFRMLGEVLLQLRAASIPVLVLKGSALGHIYYPDTGTRHMTDCDIMVPAQRVDEAIALLLKENLHLRLPLTGNFKTLFHACSLLNDKDREIDLHWRLFSMCAEDGNDALYWERAMPFTFRSQQALTLSPADQLFHTCLHGYVWNQQHSLRWVADAYYILRRDGSTMDWDTIIAQAKSRQMVLRLYKSLEFLKVQFGMAIPDALLKELQAIPVPVFERGEHEAFVMPGRPPGRFRLAVIQPLKQLWYKQQRFYPRRSLLMRVLTYPAMLSQEMRQDSIRTLPVAMMRYLFLHINNGYRQYKKNKTTTRQQRPPGTFRRIVTDPMKRVWYRQYQFYPERSLLMRVLTYPGVASKELQQKNIWVFPLTVTKYLYVCSHKSYRQYKKNKTPDPQKQTDENMADAA